MKAVKKFRVFVILIFVIGLVVTLITASMLFFKKGFFNRSEQAVTEDYVVIDNQLALPQPGESIAVVDVKDYGIIKCRLFETAAPKTVKNFIDLANTGKFNGLTFDKVVSDLMIQCSDDDENVAKTQVVKEHNPSLHAYNGALCAVRSQDNFDEQTGQFSIIFSDDGKRISFDYLESHSSEYVEDGEVGVNVKFDDNVKNNYKERGGFPIFDMQPSFCVFGQVYEGMNVVEAISKCEKSIDEYGDDDDDSLPEKEIVINSVKIEKV